MIWTLTNGATIFEISNDVTQLLRIVDRHDVSIEQDTQVDQPLRGEWPVAFPDRSSSVLSLSLPVMFAPCASDAEAFAQSLMIPVQCPKGGTLTGQNGAETITYDQCWKRRVKAVPMGRSNLFIFDFSVTDPSAATLSTLAQMDTRYVGSLSTITALTGGTATDLDGLTTTDVSVGFTCFICPTIGGVAQGKHMRLITDPAPGETAENADPTAGPLIILPDDYNETTNAKIWVEC